MSNGKVAGIAVVSAVIFAIGGFFFGRHDGEKRGKDQTLTLYEPGQPEYEAIFNSGRAEGVKSGVQSGTETGLKEGVKKGAETGEIEGQAEGERAGEKHGLEQGEIKGEVEGANDVFAGYSSWDIGSYYIVQIGKGQSSGVEYSLSNRLPITADSIYKLCSDSPEHICIDQEDSNAND